MTASLPQGAAYPDALSRTEGRDELSPSERGDCPKTGTGTTGAAGTSRETQRADGRRGPPHPGPMASQARHQMDAPIGETASRNVVPEERVTPLLRVRDDLTISQQVTAEGVIF